MSKHNEVTVADIEKMAKHLEEAAEADLDFYPTAEEAARIKAINNAFFEDDAL